MKKELKRILCAALAAAAAVGSLSGCGPKESADDGQLTWYCGVSAGGTDAMWDTATVLKKVVENTGVRPKIIIPTSGGNEKLNLLTATNTLPDLLTFDANSSDMDTLIQSNKVYPLDELIEKYAPDFKEQIPEVIWEQVKNRDDGKLYGLPSFFIDGTGSLSGTQGYNVRADIYEAIGSPDMTTPDGFVDALKKFKEQYPTIDGKESIPLDMNQQCWGLYILERSFGIVDNSYVDENGNIKVKWRNPKYRELVKFMARLNREGLLDKNMYVKQSNQIDEDRALGVSFCVPASLDQLWNASAVPVSSAIEDTLRSGGVLNLSSLALGLGEYAAPMGTGAAAVIAACGLFLWVQKDIRISASLSFLATCALIAFFFPRQVGLADSAMLVNALPRLRCVRDELLTGAILFSAVFLLNEPYTCAHHRLGRILYGVLVGLVSMGFRYYGVYETGVCFALVVVNSVSAWIDRTETRLYRLLHPQAGTGKEGAR